MNILNMFTLTLNGDAMVNLVDKPNMFEVVPGQYSCQIGERSLLNFIQSNDLELVENALLDKEDGYMYGYIK
jgi:hypothetical protein